jgi:glycine/D-amino acid oxidase-like deaminating enzyme
VGRPLTGSLWADQLAPPPPRPSLDGDLDTDVVVVGGGLTGLWTAYYLAPHRRVTVLEARHVGFGASGRNGGWCSALFPASADSIAALPGSSRELAQAQHRAMRATIDEVGAVVAAEGIDCGFAKGGTVVAARSPAQLARARHEVAEARSWGRDDVELLDAGQARSRIGASGLLGATYTPDCAAVQPLALVRGLAEACERRGVHVLEDSPATRLSPGLVDTPRGLVRARHVIRATEAWTSTLPDSRRAVIPFYSLVVATEPLSQAVWDEIGLAQRETFSDHRHLVIYGQRTADDRIVFGGRGAPYHLGSRIRPGFDLHEGIFGKLRDTLVDLFPVLAGVEVTHRWGGPLGIARDWCAGVGLDPASGTGWAGGYVGDGVSTTNLAGRTLRDLVLGEDTPLTGLPWVGHVSPRWEPEPLRWLGVNAGLRAMTWADAEERLTGRQSLLARAVSPFLH